MLAFHLDILTGYDIQLTLLSVVPGIAAALITFSVLRKAQTTCKRTVLSSLFMAVGIVTMHYTGMAAMEMSPPIIYIQLAACYWIGVARRYDLLCAVGLMVLSCLLISTASRY